MLANRVLRDHETHIHLLRHGHVENPENVRYGRLAGFRLSARGRDEVKASARALASRRRADVPIAIVSSPLSRAVESAEIARDVLGGGDIAVDRRLVEAAEWREGLPRAPSLLALLRRLARPSTWPPSEAPLAIALRVAEAILDVLDEREDGAEALVVSHQTPIRLGRLALERDLDGDRLVRLLPRAFARYPCETGSITTLVFRGRTLVRTSYAPA